MCFWWECACFECVACMVLLSKWSVTKHKNKTITFHRLWVTHNNRDNMRKICIKRWQWLQCNINGNINRNKINGNQINVKLLALFDFSIFVRLFAIWNIYSLCDEIMDFLFLVCLCIYWTALKMRWKDLSIDWPVRCFSWIVFFCFDRWKMNITFSAPTH